MSRIRKLYERLYRTGDRGGTFVAVDAEGTEWMVVSDDGSRYSSTVAGFCHYCIMARLNGAERCGRPGCPERDQPKAYGPVYPSDLHAERQASTAAAGPVGAHVGASEPVSEPVQEPLRPSPGKEPVPEVQKPAPDVRKPAPVSSMTRDSALQVGGLSGAGAMSIGPRTSAA